MEPIHLLEVQGLIIGCWNKEHDLDALIYYNLPKYTAIGFRFRVHQVSTAPHSPITRLRPRPGQKWYLEGQRDLVKNGKDNGHYYGFRV